MPKTGSGKQAFSWIYIEDVLNAFVFAIEKENLAGVLNLTSPNPITNIELTKAIGKAIRRPTIFTVPKFILKLLYGEGADVISDGQTVLPESLLKEGFTFQCNTIEDFLKTL